MEKHSDNKHIFVELAGGKVRDAKMLTPAELLADGWECDLRNTSHQVSSAWVRDPATGEKLRNELCDRWTMGGLIAYVSTAAYPATKRIEPLFGFADSDIVNR